MAKVCFVRRQKPLIARVRFAEPMMQRLATSRRMKQATIRCWQVITTV
jgi:hypothetical protein